MSHSGSIVSDSDETGCRHLYSPVDDCRSFTTICLLAEEYNLANGELYATAAEPSGSLTISLAGS